MNTINTIGFVGQAGSGKTTCAMIAKSILIDRGHIDVGILPFAAPLKQFAIELGWNGEKDEKGRRLLQLLGTECGRQCIHPDLWVMKWEDRANEYNITIADDIRFENEAKAIKKRGILIHVARGGYEGIPHHESEEFTWLDSQKPNYIINNPGPVDALYPILEKIIIRNFGEWVHVDLKQPVTTLDYSTQ